MRTKKSFRSLLGAMVAVLGLATVAQAQRAPANDNFANSQLLITPTGTLAPSNTGATAESGEPAHDGYGAGASIWYTYTPNYTGTVTFDTDGSDVFYPVLAVYTGTQVNGLTRITSGNQAYDTGGVTSVTFDVVANGKYRIALDGFGTSFSTFDIGNFMLNWRRIFPPANDNFSNATVITGTSFSEPALINNSDASSESGEPSHAGFPATRSIWYRWTPTTSGPVTITTQGSDTNTTLAVYLGTNVNTLTVVKSNDDVSTADPTSSLKFTAQANAIYYIAVDSYFDEGNVTLNLAQTLGSPTRYKVSGFVKTGQSQALAGVIISLTGSSSTNSGTTATATTNASGAYTITDILAGTYTLKAAKRGYIIAPNSLTITVTKDNSVDNNFTATLIPVPALPSISVSDVTIREGNKGDSFLTFNVSLNTASTDIISVAYTTADGTATAGSDYIAMRGNLLFAPGIVTIGVNVRLKPDTVVEGDEKFFLNILGATGASVADDFGQATIVNDDGAVSAASVSPSARSARIERRVRLARLESRHR